MGYLDEAIRELAQSVGLAVPEVRGTGEPERKDPDLLELMASVARLSASVCPEMRIARACWTCGGTTTPTVRGAAAGGSAATAQADAHIVQASRRRGSHFMGTPGCGRLGRRL